MRVTEKKPHGSGRVGVSLSLDGDIKFLIAANCDLMRSRFVTDLTKRGCNWELASDGFRALELITTTRFSAVILDQALNYFTGANLVMLSRHIPSLRSTPFFVFCLPKEIDIVQNALAEIDFTFIVNKPISPEKMDIVFERLCLVQQNRFNSTSNATAH
jgi:CheY-like chemotaxis protein